MDNSRNRNNTFLKYLLSATIIATCFAVHTPCLAQGDKAYSLSFKVRVTNPLKEERSAVMVHIPAQRLPQNFNPEAFAVFDNKTEIPSQYNKQDQDYKGIVVVLDKLKAGEARELNVRYAKTGVVKHTYAKRTQAELSNKTGGEWKNREYIGGAFKNVDYLRVPPEHKDHSWFLRYEGPGWESDKVGYRMYLDQRNAVDVFGKKVTSLALQKTGLDGFDSYHEMQEWGMDVLKVGNSLGVGSIGSLTSTGAVRVEKTDSVTCRITANGDVYSSFLTNYYGWQTGEAKVDLASRISIHAGTRLTHNRINITGSINNISTGLIKDDKANPKLITKKGDASGYGYIATYGKQSLNDDNLGIVVFFNPQQMVEFTQDKFSHIVKLAPSSGKIDYYYAGTWQLEPDGIKDEAAFVAYIDKTARELAAPVKVDIETDDRWSVRMADADMMRNPKASLVDFVTTPRWNYTNGLICTAVQKVWQSTKDEKYYQYTKAYADEMINPDGTIKTYKADEYNIDKVNSGKFLFALYDRTKDAKYDKAIKLLRDQMRTHPRTSEGGFWHKQIYPHQMWLDGLYMGSPFLAQYAAVYKEPALFDQVALQVKLIEKYTYDDRLALYYHAWDEKHEQKWADKQTGRSPHVWGRAMGWYAMALVDILDYFPKDHAAYKDILNAVNRMAKGVAQYQDASSGVWYQIVDQGNREGNYLESSASCMYAYFLIKAIKKGYISETYAVNAKKAYDGILNRFIKVDQAGVVSITDVCAVAGLGGNPYRDGSYEYYINEPKRDNDPKAVGPFIMMAVEFESWKPGKI